MSASASPSPPSRPGRIARLAVAALFLLALAMGIALRAEHLGSRPMHTDEAIHGIKFGGLLEDGIWKYDPVDYHGPALAYLTLPFAWGVGAADIEQVSEALLRAVPLVFSIGLMLLAIPLRRALGGDAIAAAALFLAVSPIVVYYSRYYIMEILLVFFSMAAIVCGWRYWVSRRPWWLVPGGFSLAMMHASKETCIIHYFAMAAAVAVCAVAGRLFPASGAAFTERVNAHALDPAHCKPLLVSALVTWFLFYSSFFTNLPEGLVESITTYAGYFNRAGGSGHEKPWFYYLQLLYWNKGTYLWSEAGLPLLALCGVATAFLRRPSTDTSLLLPRFLSVYAIVLGCVYSAISYKTPWTILGFHHAVILLAGLGAAGLWRGLRRPVARGLLAIGIAAMCAHLGYQARRATSERFDADARNPYVYSHTSRPFMRLLQRLDALAAVKSAVVESEAGGGDDGNDWLEVQVIHSESAWPLPWYTRMHHTIGYPGQIPSDDVLTRTDVIITEPQYADYFREHLSESHVEDGFHSLRPDHFLSVFIRKDLWDAYMERQSVSTAGHRG